MHAHEKHNGASRNKACLNMLLPFVPALMIMVGGGFVKPVSANTQTDFDTAKAVIFSYQHIIPGTQGHVAENALSQDHFLDHIATLKQARYEKLALSELVKHLEDGTPLPTHGVAITFEAPHKDTLNFALPLLAEAGITPLVFVTTDMVGRGGMMSWSELRRLQSDKKIEIGFTPAYYRAMSDTPSAKDDSAINSAIAQMRDELKFVPVLFAYPYGDYDESDYDMVSGRENITAAFGQQSGVVYAQTDRYALPRFVMTEPYGDAERFNAAIEALPLPVTDVLPQAPRISRIENTNIEFSIDPALVSDDGLSCFASDIGKTDVKKVADGRYKAVITAPVDGRIRINCTMPAGDADDIAQSWRWTGFLLSAPSLSPDSGVLKDEPSSAFSPLEP